MTTIHTDRYAIRPTVARPGVIVSTIVDSSGIEPIAQTVTFTRSSLPPFFTTRVQYTTPDDARRQHAAAEVEAITGWLAA